MTEINSLGAQSAIAPQAAKAAMTGELLRLLQPQPGLIAPGETEPMNDAAAIRERFEKMVQAIVDAGACPMRPTTVVDISGETPVLVRLGRGDPALLGIAEQTA